MMGLAALLACGGRRIANESAAVSNTSLSGFVEPPQVQSILEESAASTETMIRAKALHALVRTDASPGAGVWAPRGIWDPEPWIQWTAVEAMLHRPLNSEGESLLFDLIQRESVTPQIRCPIAFRLGMNWAHQVLPLIQPEYAMEGGGQAKVVCALTGWFLGDESAHAALVAHLQDEGIPMDPYFMHLLVEGGERIGTEVLKDTMEWAEEGVDLQLAGVLARQDVPEGWDRLERGLNSDDELEGWDSLDLLLTIDRPRTMSILKTQSSVDTLAGIGASMYLEIIEDRKPVTLRAYGTSEDRDERTLAVEMAALAMDLPLSNRMMRECRALLTAGLTDESFVVRLATYQALRQHATVSQLQRMAVLLTQVEPSERLEVALAIRYRMSGQ